MPKRARTQGRVVNGLCAIICELTELLRATLEIHCPGSEEGQKKCQELRFMAASLINDSAGYPFAESAQPESATQEVVK